MVKRYFVPAALLALLLLSGCSGAGDLVKWASLPAERSSSAALVDEADRLVESARGAEAILTYRQAVERDPRNSEALEKLAKAYAEQGRRRTAERYLLRAQAVAAKETPAAGPPVASAVQAGADLAKKWQASVGQSVPTGIAAGEKVVYASLEDGTLAALDRDSGALLWQTQVKGGIASAPEAAPGLVLVGGQDGALHARSEADGGELWRGAATSPVYAAFAAGDLAFGASGDGTLYAFAVADGAPRWTFATEGPLHGQPAVSGSTLYAGSGDGRLYAVEAATGRPIWPHGVQTQANIESQPVIAGGRLLVGAGDGRLYALAPESGGEYWHYSMPDAVYCAPGRVWRLSLRRIRRSDRGFAGLPDGRAALGARHRFAGHSSACGGRRPPLFRRKRRSTPVRGRPPHGPDTMADGYRRLGCLRTPDQRGYAIPGGS